MNFILPGLDRRAPKLRHIAVVLALTASTFALAACGGDAGPSVENIRSALKVAVLANPTSKNNTFYRFFRGYAGDTSVLRDSAQVGALLDKAKLETSACTAATNAAGYYCDYRVGWSGVVEVPEGVTVPEWSDWYKGRFFQSGGNWSFEEQK